MAKSKYIDHLRKIKSYKYSSIFPSEDINTKLGPQSIQISGKQVDYNEFNAVRKSIIEKIKSPCSEIILGFYWEGKSLKIIAEELKIKDLNALRAKKQKCMERNHHKRLKARENFWIQTLETLKPKCLNQELN